MIALGCDHGGFNLKAAIIRYLEEENIAYKDFGCFSTDSADFPDIAFPVAEAVANGEYDRGILFCGTGIGMSIAANKVKGIRCALCHDVFSAVMTREHNDTNVLAMGERVIGPGLAVMIADKWLKTEFSSEKNYARRMDMITGYEND